MIRPFTRAALLAAAAAGLLAAAPAHAASLHERGAITAVDGATVRITTRDGKALTLNLDDGWELMGIEKASMADIKPGTYIGTATTGEDEGLKALEVVVLPESMRGLGEGHFGWDLQPKSMMTNATVSRAVKSVDGQTVTLTYKGGEKKVEIDDSTPIVKPGEMTRADLKPGVKVFAITPAESGGKMDKGTLVVGKDGLTPPM